ncbi:hypothetical protein D3C75_786550 [compost metagenome]
MIGETVHEPERHEDRCRAARIHIAEVFFRIMTGARSDRSHAFLHQLLEEFHRLHIDRGIHGNIAVLIHLVGALLADRRPPGPVAVAFKGDHRLTGLVQDLLACRFEISPGLDGVRTHSCLVEHFFVVIHHSRTYMVVNPVVRAVFAVNLNSRLHNVAKLGFHNVIQGHELRCSLHEVRKFTLFNIHQIRCAYPRLQGNEQLGMHVVIGDGRCFQRNGLVRMAVVPAGRHALIKLLMRVNKRPEHYFFRLSRRFCRFAAFRRLAAAVAFCRLVRRGCLFIPVAAAAAEPHYQNHQ